LPHVETIEGEIVNEIERSLESFYRDYIDRFNSADVERFLEYFARPYVSVSGERGVRVVANDPGHASGFRRLMDGLKERGWVRSEIVAIKAWALEDNLGMILSDVVRMKADNSLLEEVRACYLVRREHQAWKIATISEVSPPFLGPGDVPRHSP
jgi:hypothetical protein